MASAKPARLAAQYNSGLIDQNRQNNQALIGQYGQQALGALSGSAAPAAGAYRSGAAGAIGSINQGAAQAGNALRTGATRSLADLAKGYTAGRDALTTGYQDATGYLAPQMDKYNPWIDNGVQASNARNDFLGLNGADASGAQAAALANFRNSTGYQSILDSATDNAMRKANAVGMLGSGNTLDALARIGGNLADQSGQQYFNNLGVVSGEGLNALGQQTGVAGSLANLATGFGQNMSNLGMQNATARAGVNSALGSGLAGIYGNQGQQRAAVQSSLGNSLGSLYGNQGTAAANIYSGMGNALVNNNNLAAQGLTDQMTGQANASMAAKNANQNALMSGVGMGLNLLTSAFGVPSGGAGGSAGSMMKLFGG